MPLMANPHTNRETSVVIAGVFYCLENDEFCCDHNYDIMWSLRLCTRSHFASGYTLPNPGNHNVSSKTSLLSMKNIQRCSTAPPACASAIHRRQPSNASSPPLLKTPLSGSCSLTRLVSSSLRKHHRSPPRPKVPSSAPLALSPLAQALLYLPSPSSEFPGNVSPFSRRGNLNRSHLFYYLLTSRSRKTHSIPGPGSFHPPLTIQRRPLSTTSSSVLFLHFPSVHR